MLYPAEFGRDPLFPRAEDFSVVIKDNMVGRGVITHRSWRRGEVLARMAGHVVGEIRQHTLQISPVQHNYDPYFSGYFLHSCSPNVSLDMRQMLVSVLEDIPAGGFLYMDYAETEDFLFKQFPCNCGSPRCRGWIAGRLELPQFNQSEQIAAVRNLAPFPFKAAR